MRVMSTIWYPFKPLGTLTRLEHQLASITKQLVLAKPLLSLYQLQITNTQELVSVPLVPILWNIALLHLLPRLELSQSIY